MHRLTLFSIVLVVILLVIIVSSICWQNCQARQLTTSRDVFIEADHVDGPVIASVKTSAGTLIQMTNEGAMRVPVSEMTASVDLHPDYDAYFYNKTMSVPVKSTYTIAPGTDGILCVLKRGLIDLSDDLNIPIDPTVVVVQRSVDGTTRTLMRLAPGKSVQLTRREEFMVVPKTLSFETIDSNLTGYYYTTGTFINVYDENDERTLNTATVKNIGFGLYSDVVTIAPKSTQTNVKPYVTLWSGETKHVFTRGSYPTLDFVPDRIDGPLPLTTMCTFFEGENFTGTASESINKIVKSMRVASSSSACRSCTVCTHAYCPKILFKGKLNGNRAQMMLAEGEYALIRMDDMRIISFPDGAYVSLFTSPNFENKARGLISRPSNMMRSDIRSIIVAGSKPCPDCSSFNSGDYKPCPCVL